MSNAPQPGIFMSICSGCPGGMVKAGQELEGTKGHNFITWSFLFIVQWSFLVTSIPGHQCMGSRLNLLVILAGLPVVRGSGSTSTLKQNC